MPGKYTHGYSDIPEYRVWASMRQRCQNPRNCRYSRYGARGISICERWSDFSQFFEDMGPRPSPSHSIDRINNDGNYQPDNCRWATRSEQQRNKSGHRTDHKIPRGDAHWTRRNPERARRNAQLNIKNSHKCGAENSNAKITREIADAVRSAHSAHPYIKMADLGAQFGIGRETTRKIIRGLSWA